MMIKKKLSRIRILNKLIVIYKRVMYRRNPEKFLSKHFYHRTGYKLNISNPQTYNEKLQWLKLYWYDRKAQICSDKFAFRAFVKDKKLDKYLNEVYGVYNNPMEIDFNSLPDKFVLKSNHASGQVITCKDKKTLNWKKSIKEMKRWLKTDYYYHSFEWVYKGIRPKIICEKLIETEDGSPPRDYKIFCFNGAPKFLFVASDRNDKTTKFDFFDVNWNKLDVQQHYPNSQYVINKPKELDEMLKIASILSNDFPHARVDFYLENNRIIIGEVTFFHFSGNQPFNPIEFDYLMGNLLKLPKKSHENIGKC